MGNKTVYFPTGLEVYVQEYAKENHLKFSAAVQNILHKYRKIKGNQPTIGDLQKSIEAYRRELFKVQEELAEIKSNE